MTLTSPPCGRPHPAAPPGPSGRPGHAAGGDPAAGYPSLVRGGCPPRPAPGQRGPPGLSGAIIPARATGIRIAPRLRFLAIIACIILLRVIYI